MKKIDRASPEASSANLVAENIQKLKELFPSLITEGENGAVINTDTLKSLVGDNTVTDADEKYGLNWHGKRRSRNLALTPSTGTLRPCPEDSLNWDTTQNIMIEGDNLEVLKLLQKSYAGKIKLIYIDPPYNTGKDFVYPDNFKDNIKNYLELTEQLEGGQKISTNVESSGRYHTDWLNMMYPRLKLARNLLQDDGAVFISIDDNEIDNLNKICSDIFGEENRVGIFIWKSKSGGANDSGEVAVDHEYILCYSKNKECGDVLGNDSKAVASTSYNHKDDFGNYSLERLDKQNLGYQKSLDFTIKGPDGLHYKISQRNPRVPNARWRWSKKTVMERFSELVFKDGKVYTKNYEKVGGKPRSLLVDERFGRTRTGSSELRDLMKEECFDNPKPMKLVNFITEVGASPLDSIILDFFAGSGTTGHAVMEQNAQDGGSRRFILVQLPEPLDPKNKDQKVAADFCNTLKKPLAITELTKERLRRAGAKIKKDNPSFNGDIGFRTFKLDHSNIKAWDPYTENLENALLEHQDHLLEGRTGDDVLFEMMLKHGIDLSAPIEQRVITGHTVYCIGAGALMACLEDNMVSDQVIALGQGIASWSKEQENNQETVCLFRDSAFIDDASKINLSAVLEQNGIHNIRSI